jgi:hypothetical protein
MVVRQSEVVVPVPSADPVQRIRISQPLPAVLADRFQHPVPGTAGQNRPENDRLCHQPVDEVEDHLPAQTLVRTDHLGGLKIELAGED